MYIRGAWQAPGGAAADHAATRGRRPDGFAATPGQSGERKERPRGLCPLDPQQSHRPWPGCRRGSAPWWGPGAKPLAFLSFARLLWCGGQPIWTSRVLPGHRRREKIRRCGRARQQRLQRRVLFALPRHQRGHRRVIFVRVWELILHEAAVVLVGQREQHANVAHRQHERQHRFMPQQASGAPGAGVGSVAITGRAARASGRPPAASGCWVRSASVCRAGWRV